MSSLSKYIRRTPAAIAAACAFTLFTSASVSAQVNVNKLSFELDGNIILNDPTVPPTLVDWAALFDGSVPPKALTTLPDGFSSATFLRDFDPSSSAEASMYTTGSKDTLPITPGWQCKGSNNINDKVDLLNTYAVIYKDPISGHRIVYFGLETASNEGTRDVGVWLLQDGSVNCVSPPPNNPTTSFTGNHQDGDVLIVAEYTGSSGVSTINVFKWSGDATTGSLVQLGTGSDCRDGAVPPNDRNGGPSCATTNRVVLKAGASGVPWLTKTKTSKPSQPGLTSADLDIGEFFEGGVDLTASGLNGCFATILVDTRSSASTTATLFDFARGKFQDCKTTLKTEIHSGAAPADPTHTANATDIQATSVPIGSTVHDKALVTGNIGTSSPDPTGSVTFKLYSGDNCGATTGTLLSTSSAITLVKQSSSTATAGAIMVAEWGDFSPTTAGKYSYAATYSGDGNYPSSSDGCEPITFNTVASAVTTDIRTNAADATTTVLNKKVNKGTTVYDFALVTGVAGLGNPTGTVTFFRYPNANCSGTAAPNPESVTLTANAGSNPPTSYAISSGYTTTADAGEFVSFKAVYTPATGSPYDPDIADLCEPICSFADSPTIPAP